MLGVVVLAGCGTSKTVAAGGVCELRSGGVTAGGCAILRDARYDVVWNPATDVWTIEPLMKS